MDMGYASGDNSNPGMAKVGPSNSTPTPAFGAPFSFGNSQSSGSNSTSFGGSDRPFGGGLGAGPGIALPPQSSAPSFGTLPGSTASFGTLPGGTPFGGTPSVPAPSGPFGGCGTFAPAAGGFSMGASDQGGHPGQSTGRRKVKAKFK